MQHQQRVFVTRHQQKEDPKAAVMQEQERILSVHSGIVYSVNSCPNTAVVFQKKTL
jgi:hypothetical protein